MQYIRNKAGANRLERQKAGESGGMTEEREMNINDWANRILYDKPFCRSEYQKFVGQNDSLDRVTGFIDSNLLYQVIRKAKRRRIYRDFLSDLLYYTNADSMTDRNFRLLLKFPKKDKKTFLSCIGHSELSFYQMQILNREALSLEAFSWLFDRICRYDFFSHEDMLQILRENSDIRSVAINHCIETAKSKYGPSAKLDIAKEWSDQLKGREKRRRP